MRGFSVKEDSAYTSLSTHPRETHYNDKGMKYKYPTACQGREQKRSQVLLMSKKFQQIPGRQKVDKRSTNQLMSQIGEVTR